MTRALDGPSRAEETGSFPLVVFMLSLGTLAGLYYFLFVEVLVDLGQRGNDGGWIGWLGSGLAAALAAVGAQPLLALALFVGLLTPGLVFYHRARPYFFTLILGCLLVCGSSFALAKNPAKRLGEAIHHLLSIERELPRT